METQVGLRLRLGPERVPCPACRGVGERALECPACDGTGEEICEACRHGGFYLPPWDIGPTACPVCRGTGHQQCAACAGQGQVWKECPTCEGTGLLDEKEAEAFQAARERAERLRKERVLRSQRQGSSACRPEDREPLDVAGARGSPSPWWRWLLRRVEWRGGAWNGEGGKAE